MLANLRDRETWVPRAAWEFHVAKLKFEKEVSGVEVANKEGENDGENHDEGLERGSEESEEEDDEEVEEDEEVPVEVMEEGAGETKEAAGEEGAPTANGVVAGKP